MISQINRSNVSKKVAYFFITISFTLFLSKTSMAIPEFARKYNTSCLTCHDAYPKLNQFGEAFRMNGYAYPVNDEEKVKAEPIVMGSEGYKKAWPNAVWPNSIPKSVPIAIRGRTAYEMTTVKDQTTAEFSRPALQLLAAGSLGENISAFAGAHLFENGEVGSIDRFFVRFNNLLTQILPEKALYIQIGQFIPEMVPFASLHRGLTNSAYAFNTYDPSMKRTFVAGHVHGAGPFGIEAFQLGIEASGIIKSRLRYVAGVVNGSGTEVDINADKDFYGRLCYKLGGMSFDGTVKEGKETEKETSFALGIFVYKGIGTNNAMNYGFYRAGSDVNIYYRNFNILGGYIQGSNGIGEIKRYNLFFTEIDYKMYPWLTGILRYEQANPDSLNSFSQIIPHITALMVSNLKFKIESRLNPEKFRFDNLYLGLEYAF